MSRWPIMEERFWSSIQKTDTCWVWISCKNDKGYGLFYANGFQWKAHRWSYKYLVGEILNDLNVLHKCDNPPCVNPSHLFLGTQLDNIIDRTTKGHKNK